MLRTEEFLPKEELAVLLKFVDGELEEWAQQDTLEENAYGNLCGMDQLPERSKKTLQTAARYYVRRIKERGPEFKEEVQANLQKAQQVSEDEGWKKVSITDPDSRFMKNNKGELGKIELSYNPQITVDKAGVVVASDVCQNASDSEQQQPQVHQTDENLGHFPEHVVWSFDAGYFESENLQFLWIGISMDVFLTTMREKRAIFLTRRTFSTIPKRINMCALPEKR